MHELPAGSVARVFKSARDRGHQPAKDQGATLLGRRALLSSYGPHYHDLWAAGGPAVNHGGRIGGTLVSPLAQSSSAQGGTGGLEYHLRRSRGTSAPHAQRRAHSSRSR